ncbi:hypothetical protein, partial [Alkalihalobacillus alcalophilus]|uniref:hypothetical protein n=1 Tax=Alkalihalobacillus alcalophilus TaxID=1445 RepID=UPI001B3B2FFE
HGTSKLSLLIPTYSHPKHASSIFSLPITTNSHPTPAASLVSLPITKFSPHKSSETFLFSLSSP